MFCRPKNLCLHEVPRVVGGVSVRDELIADEAAKRDEAVTLPHGVDAVVEHHIILVLTLARRNGWVIDLDDRCPSHADGR